MVLVFTATSNIAAQTTQITTSELETLQMNKQNIEKKIVSKKQELEKSQTLEDEFLITKEDYFVPGSLGGATIAYDYIFNSSVTTGVTGNEFPTVLTYIGGGIIAATVTGLIIDEFIIEPIMKKNRKTRRNELRDEILTLERVREDIDRKIVEIEYKKTTEENTLSRYKEFVENHSKNDPYYDEAMTEVFEYYKNIDSFEGYKEFLLEYPNSAYFDEAREKANSIYDAIVANDYIKLKRQAPESFWDSFPVVRRGILDFKERTLDDIICSGELQEGVGIDITETGTRTYKMVLNYEQTGMEKGEIVLTMRQLQTKTILIESIEINTDSGASEYLEEWNEVLFMFSTLVVNGLHKPKPDFLN